VPSEELRPYTDAPDDTDAWSHDHWNEAVVIAHPSDQRFTVPVCTVCGHGACPCCGDWCDTITKDDDLCCDARCIYSPQDRERFGLD